MIMVKNIVSLSRTKANLFNKMSEVIAILSAHKQWLMTSLLVCFPSSRGSTVTLPDSKKAIISPAQKVPQQRASCSSTLLLHPPAEG